MSLSNKQYTSYILSLLFVILFSYHDIQAQSVRKFYKKLNLEKLTHCGVLIYNAENNDTVFKHHADAYFTPASTTKLFTFYSALQNLPDTLAAFKYELQNDTLYVWGVGNPSFLNPAFKNYNDTAVEFLKTINKPIVLCYNRYTGKPYGKGWMWDDYNDMYQPEMNEFPILGNILDIEIQQKEAKIYPNISDFTYEWNEKFERNYHNNHFKIPKNLKDKEPVTYIVSAKNTAQILSTVLNKKVYLNTDKKLSNTALVQYSSIPRDTVLKFMMEESDNFTAEQMHLMICDAKNIEMNTEKSIEYLKTYTFDFIKDTFEWVDGSGLSRYNLFKPAQMVTLLNVLQNQQDSSLNIQNMLAIGGKSGTIKKMFTSDYQPYVFAKTGTMTGVACLAGFVKTKSNKTLTFAIMTNNHVAKAKEIRAEIEKLIDFIHENY